MSLDASQKLFPEWIKACWVNHLRGKTEQYTHIFVYHICAVMEYLIETL